MKLFCKQVKRGQMKHSTWEERGRVFTWLYIVSNLGVLDLNEFEFVINKLNTASWHEEEAPSEQLLVKLS